jgi:hypothetical protein
MIECVFSVSSLSYFFFHLCESVTKSASAVDTFMHNHFPGLAEPERLSHDVGSKSLTTLALIICWFVLSAMVVLVAFQCHSLAMSVGAWIINSPTLRPGGWSSTTLSPISSFAYLVLGGLVLAVVTYIEQGLSQAATENRLLRQAGKYAGLIAVIWIICLGLQLLAM